MDIFDAPFELLDLLENLGWRGHVHVLVQVLLNVGRFLLPKLLVEREQLVPLLLAQAESVDVDRVVRRYETDG